MIPSPGSAVPDRNNATQQALEPYISAQIMELHHTKHHAAYVANLNKALQSHVAAVTSSDIAAQIALQAAIKFNGGGHINHSLFWQNLTPPKSAEAKPDAAPSLTAEITKAWGSLDEFKKAFSAALLGIQGSGWGWLVKDAGAGLRIVTTKDQDPVVGGEVPVFGVDMWEHAYYLQVCDPSAPLSQPSVRDVAAADPRLSCSTSMERRRMWRTFGTSSTGRRRKSVFSAPVRMSSRL